MRVTCVLVWFNKNIPFNWVQLNQQVNKSEWLVHDYAKTEVKGNKK